MPTFQEKSDIYIRRSVSNVNMEGAQRLVVPQCKTLKQNAKDIVECNINLFSAVCPYTCNMTSKGNITHTVFIFLVFDVY